MQRNKFSYLFQGQRLIFLSFCLCMQGIIRVVSINLSVIKESWVYSLDSSNRFLLGCVLVMRIIQVGCLVGEKVLYRGSCVQVRFLQQVGLFGKVRYFLGGQGVKMEFLEGGYIVLGLRLQRLRFILCFSSKGQSRFEFQIFRELVGRQRRERFMRFGFKEGGGIRVEIVDSFVIIVFFLYFQEALFGFIWDVDVLFEFFQ